MTSPRPASQPARAADRSLLGRIPFLRFSGLIPTRRAALVALCVIVASLADGFGIASLLPLMSVLGDDAAKASGMSKIILGALDKVHIPHDPIVLLGLVVGGTILKGVLMVLTTRMVSSTVAEVSAKLRLWLVDALINARWSYYVHQPVGRFSAALGAEATGAGEAYMASMQMLSQSVQAVVYLSVAALVSWQLAVFTLLVSAIMLSTLARFLTISKAMARNQSALLRVILGRLTDVLIGIKPMKAMSRQARFAQLFDRDLKEIKRTYRRQAFAKNVNKALQEPILALCLAAGIFVSLTVLKMPVAEVIVMCLLLIKTVMVIGKSQQELQNFYANQNGLITVEDAIAEAREQAESQRGRLTPTLDRQIAFEGVGFSYDGKPVLQSIDLQIETGTLVSVTGSSGAGKTTLVDVLLGFHQPQSGRILVDGQPLSEIDLIQWRSLIGYVPQELILFHETIAANMTLGEPRFTEADIERALRSAGADFVDQLAEGANTVVGERGSALSGGQRQRIALARALLHQPKLLILDEATSALDPQTEEMIIANVLRLVREQGLTVISVTHHPAWLGVSDQVIRLSGGRLQAAQPAVA
ncbi:ABC transporter ATP-binding protein [Hydrocarboniphaga effusa]|uniref:ABC transporter ATP-binding protein n=1 Tax=Hydrocarboniphaga effusa TaxID=243629 RepID=UPI00398C086C